MRYLTLSIILKYLERLDGSVSISAFKFENLTSGRKLLSEDTKS